MHDVESLWQSLLEQSVSHILIEQDYNGLIEMLSTSPVLDALFADEHRDTQNFMCVT